MYGKLIIDGNAVYEVDEACLLRQGEKKRNSQGSSRGMEHSSNYYVGMNREPGERGSD